MNDSRPLILIGVPCGDRVHSQFMQCIWGAGRGAKHHRQGLAIGQSSIVANGRNQCVEALYATKADYLMQIDSDLSFPWNGIDRLLAHDKDIVCATYPRRGPPFDNLGKTLYEKDADRTSGLVEMSHIPTGFLLCRKTVFDKLSRPWFRFGVDEVAGIVIGEDMEFSSRARAAGFSLWCDLSLSDELQHWYQYPLVGSDPATRESAEGFKKALAANG